MSSSIATLLLLTFTARDSFSFQGIGDFCGPKLFRVHVASAFQHSLTTHQAEFLQAFSMRSCKNLIFYSRFSQSVVSCRGKNPRSVLIGHESLDKDKLRDLRKLHGLGLAPAPTAAVLLQLGREQWEMQCQLNTTSLCLVLY